MKRRGVGSIVAVIFLVMMMGVAMLAFISIYGNYRELYSLQSEMNRWETQRLRERLVSLEESGGGGEGGGSNTLNRTFLVADEYVTVGDQKTDTPRLWYFDVEDNDYERIDSDGPKEVNVTFTILTTKLSAYSGEDWDFTLKMILRTIPANVNVNIYAYNHQTGQFDVIDSFQTTTASWFSKMYTLDWGTYVANENATIRIYEIKDGHHKVQLRIDRMILEGIYTYSQPLNYSRFNVSSTDPPKSSSDLAKLRSRDGSTITTSGDLDLTCTISGLPTSVTFRDISGFVTIASYRSAEYEVDVYAYNYTSSQWVLTNSTYLDQNEEDRIRIPLSSDFVSSGGVVKLRIEADRESGYNVYLDEVIVEATWLTSGGGNGGSFLIRNDSPFASRIVRIWYINDTYTYIYDPSNYIVLQPGETLDLSTYHSLTNIDLVKVVTDYGNVFSFIP